MSMLFCKSVYIVSVQLLGETMIAVKIAIDSALQDDGVKTEDAKNCWRGWDELLISWHFAIWSSDILTYPSV